MFGAQFDYRPSIREGYAGDPGDMTQPTGAVITRNNNSLEREVKRFTFTATNDALYTLTIEGVTISYTAGSSGTTTTTLSTDFLAMFNGQDISATGAVMNSAAEDGMALGGLYEASVDGSLRLVLTSREDGATHTITQSSNIAQATVTAASTGVNLYFGKFAMQATEEGGCERPSASAAAAQISTITITPANNAKTEVSVRLEDGREYTSTVTSAGTAVLADDLAAHLSRLNAILPADTVLASENDTVLTLTSEVAGVPFTPGFGTDTATATAVIATTTANADVAVTRSILGILARVHTIPQSYEPGSVFDGISYPAGYDCSIARKGTRWVDVEDDDSVTIGDTVYCRVSGTGEGI